MFKLVGFTVILLVITAYLFIDTEEKAAQETTITVQEVNNKIDNNENIVLLDVRTQSEYEGPLGHIDNSILIPIQELENRITELNQFKEKQIIVICKSDFRSSMGTKILREAGFDALTMEGGMLAYRAMVKDTTNILKETELEIDTTKFSEKN